MSSPRVAFADSTNSPRSPRRISNRLISKLGSTSARKSAPTCTISLANVSANDLCIDLTSTPSFSSSTTNFIPFPSSPPECLDTPFSQPDRTCLLLLRSSPDTPLQPKADPSLGLQVPSERRKRTTTRLLLPTTSSTAERCSCAEVPNQPPRKRPRLQKTKTVKPESRAPPLSSADVRFLAMVQRNVASGVMERREQSWTMEAVLFETLDELLARRLRIRLLGEGCRMGDLVDLATDDLMDVDPDMNTPLVASADMDVAVENTTRERVPLAPKSILSSPPRVHTPLSLERHISPTQLVAAHIMRQHVRKASIWERTDKQTEQKRSPLSISSF